MVVLSGVVAGWFARSNLEWGGDYIKWCASFRSEAVSVVFWV